MAKVIIALGSNLSNRLEHLRDALNFLTELSEEVFAKSMIYESEPVGPSENEFLNAVVAIKTNLSPNDLLFILKKHERSHGRPSRYPKWTSRTIDLDIIAFDDLVIETDNLIIPHQEYSQRLFVLLPLKDIEPNWIDPDSGKSIDLFIKNASKIMISKTTHTW